MPFSIGKISYLSLIFFGLEGLAPVSDLSEQKFFPLLGKLTTVEGEDGEVGSFNEIYLGNGDHEAVVDLFLHLLSPSLRGLAFLALFLLVVQEELVFSEDHRLPLVLSSLSSSLLICGNIFICIDVVARNFFIFFMRL
jgi:hypothetical protein